MTNFDSFLQVFKSTDLWANMAATVENSPWHREKNVAVHTEMVLDFYEKNFAQSRSEKEQMITRLALLFHDVGKPAAMTAKHSEERGDYFVFAGHEGISARLFEDWAMSNKYRLFEVFNLNDEDVRKIRWLIENHLPYDVKNVQKRADFKRDMMTSLGAEQLTFFDMLLSDSNGRISDDHAAKLLRVGEWVKEFADVKPSELREFSEITPTAWILIGASGSGKSTFQREWLNVGSHNIVTVSLDQYRIDFYKKQHEGALLSAKEVYANAFNFALANEKEFNKFYQAEFNVVLSKKVNVVVDNVHASRKSRASWIAALKQKGYRVIGVEFPIALQTVLDRQHSRSDKQVPDEAVRQQYMRISSPAIGSEVDSLLVFTGLKVFDVES